MRLTPAVVKIIKAQGPDDEPKPDGHVPTATRVYDRYSYDAEKRAALET